MQIRGCLRVEVRSSGDREIAKGNKEIWGSDGYVYHLDGDAGFIGVYGYQTYEIVHCKHVQFIVCQLHFNKAVK